MASPDPRLPLFNLSLLGQKMDSLRRFLSESVDRNASIGGDQLQMVSTEIASAVQQTILNGAALLASSLPQCAGPRTPVAEPVAQIAGKDADQAGDRRDLIAPTTPNDLAAEDDDADCDIVEIDAAELMAEHVHFCEVCGKGFKRDANLRMHMRAHGNQFKTLEALSKPPGDHQQDSDGRRRWIRFSCPFAGCNRNRAHRRFRPLKSVACVKNHFKRSHCPKMYPCNRCNKKSFSVVTELRRHLLHCGEGQGRCRWRCSCEMSFSRKDKLFRHVELFEGHVPVVTAGEEEEVVGKGKGKGKGKEKGVVVDDCGERGGVEPVDEALDPEFFDRLMEEFGAIEGMFGRTPLCK